MKDAADEETLDLPLEGKKRGRKPKSPLGAMSDAARKREQRARQWTQVAESDSSSWTEATCLSVLASAKVPNGSPLDKAAWLRLGEIRGYVAEKPDGHE